MFTLVWCVYLIIGNFANFVQACSHLENNLQWPQVKDEERSHAFPGKNSFVIKVFLALSNLSFFVIIS